MGMAPGAADTPDPSPWPARTGVDPGIDATAHSIRIAGADRVHTSLSTALALRGKGPYPFAPADRPSGPPAPLADADRCLGLATCPFPVLLTPAPTPATSPPAPPPSPPTPPPTHP